MNGPNSLINSQLQQQQPSNVLYVQDFDTPGEHIPEHYVSADDLIDEGTTNIINSFSDKYAVILGLVLYERYITPMLHQMFEVLMSLLVAMLVLNLSRFWIDSVAKEKHVLKFWGEMFSNIEGAASVVAIKIFAALVQQLVIDPYDRIAWDFLVLFFLVPFLILKTIPVIVIGVLILAPAYSGNKEFNTRVLTHLEGFVGAFSEKYSLLLAIDVYDWGRTTSRQSQNEWAVWMLLILGLVYTIRRVVREFRASAHLNQVLLWRLVGSLCHYFTQLLIILEIKYINSLMDNLSTKFLDGFVDYVIVVLLWIPIVAIRSSLAHSENSWFRGIVGFIDSFLDKYLLLVSFDLYDQLGGLVQLNSLNTVLVLVGINFLSFLAENYFEHFLHSKHMGLVVVWQFGFDLLNYTSHIFSLVALKIFTVLLTNVATYTQFFSVALVLLSSPFCFFHLAPVMLNKLVL